MDLHRSATRLLFLIFASVVMAGMSISSNASSAEPDRPNIVLIMADDMGFSDIGCYGGEVRTPNLDGLAEQGMRFTRFYNNAKCTTTRMSLLTGLYPRKGGRGIRLLDDRMVTLAEVLRDAGYRTALSGKWHLGDSAPDRPIDRGFETFYGLLDGCCNFFDPSIPDPPFKGGRVRVFARDDHRITEFPDDFYTTDAFTDHAIASLRRFRDETPEDPVFLHVTYTAPHYPLHALPEDITRYEGVYDIGWDTIRERRHERQVAMGLIDPAWKLPPRGREVTPWEEADNRDWQALRMAVYAAMIDRMDRNIGRILDTLDELGMADDTLVLFLSDNGGCAERPGGDDPSRIPGPKEYYTHCGPGWAYAQNTPFRRYKQWVHEGGISTPLIARWPGHVPAGSITREPGHIIDFMPTFAELAETSYPKEYEGLSIRPVEGLSLVPLLEGGSRTGHDALFWHWAGNRAITEGDWKLAWDRGVKRWELYDLAADRTETENLAADHPDRVAAMSARWRSWAERCGIDGD